MAYEMSINGRKLSVYNARLVDYTVSASGTSSDYTSGVGRSTLNFLNSTVTSRTVSFTVTIKGKNRYDVSAMLSKLDKEVRQKCELFMPDEFYYSCIFESEGEVVWQLPTRLAVSYSFTGIKHSALIDTVLKDGTCICFGTDKADCRLEFVTQTAVPEFRISVQNEIDNYTILVKNVRPNEVLAIDGMTCEVLLGDGHIYDSTDLVEFPYLMPGKNAITTSAPAKTTLKYYPIYT